MLINKDLHLKYALISMAFSYRSVNKLPKLLNQFKNYNFKIVASFYFYCFGIEFCDYLL